MNYTNSINDSNTSLDKDAMNRVSTRWPICCILLVNWYYNFIAVHHRCASVFHECTLRKPLRVYVFPYNLKGAPNISPSNKFGTNSLSRLKSAYLWIKSSLVVTKR